MATGSKSYHRLFQPVSLPDSSASRRARASSKRSRLSSGGTLKPVELVGEGAAANTEFQPAIHQAVGLTDLPGEPTHVVDRKDEDGRDDADRARPAGNLHGRQQGLGMGEIVDEVMLGNAQGVETQRLGENTFLDGVLIEAVRRVGEIGPVARKIEAESHGTTKVTER